MTHDHMSAVKKDHISDAIVANDAHFIVSDVLYVKVLKICLIFSHFHGVKIFLEVTPNPST